MPRVLFRFLQKRNFKEHLGVVIVLLVVLIISFYDIVFLNKTLKTATGTSQALVTGPYGQENNRLKFFSVQSTDSSQMEEPLYEFIRQSLRQGIWPLWNPHQGCGFPMTSLMEMGFLFPTTLFFYFIPQLYAWDVSMLCRFFFAGLFTYWLMRTWRFSRLPSSGAALMFMLSGPMVVHQWTMTNVEIITPLLLLTLERLIRNPSRKTACAVAWPVALTFFGGHAEHILFVNTFALFFFFFRMVSLRKVMAFRKTLVLLTLAYALGLGLSAVVSLPFFHNLNTELWHAHTSLSAASEGGDRREYLLSVLMPAYFQKEIVTITFARLNWVGGYIGVLPMALAFLGLWHKQKGGLNYFLFWAAALNFIRTSFNPDFLQFINHFPIFRDCRFSPHTVHLFAFCVALLGGMGVRAFLAQKRNFPKGLWFTLPLLLFLLGMLKVFRKSAHFQLSLQATITAGVILAVFLLVLWMKDRKGLPGKVLGLGMIFLIAAELIYYIPRERARRFDSFPRTPFIETIKNMPERTRVYGFLWALTPDSASGYQVDDLAIFTALPLERFVKFVNRCIRENNFQKDLNRIHLMTQPTPFFPDQKPLTDSLNVGFVVYPKEFSPLSGAQQAALGLTTFSVNDVILLKNERSFPRAYVVHKVYFEPEEQTMFRRLITVRKELRTVSVLQHEPVPEITAALPSGPVPGTSQAFITKYTPNEVLIDAQLSAAGMLVLSDAFHPDWKAYIDGHKTPIYFTNGLVRSVFVPAGRHEVRFSFQPLDFYLGVFISGLSFLLCLGCWLFKKGETCAV